MKKGKKIWNRLLSLMLCLVMTTGMFAVMGMEAEAAFYGDVVTYFVDCTQEGLTGGSRYPNSRVVISGEFPDGSMSKEFSFPANVELKAGYSYKFKTYSTDGVYATEILEYDAPKNYNQINLRQQVYGANLTVNVKDSYNNSKSVWMTLHDRNDNRIDARTIDGSYTYTGLRYDTKYTAKYYDTNSQETYSATTSGDSIGRNGQTITVVIPVKKSLIIQPTLEGKALENATVKVNGNVLSSTDGNYIILLAASADGMNYTVSSEYKKEGGAEFMGYPLTEYYSNAYSISENITLKGDMKKTIDANWNLPVIGRWEKDNSNVYMSYDVLNVYSGSTENVGTFFELEWKNPLGEDEVTTSWTVVSGDSIKVVNPTAERTKIECVKGGTSTLRFTASWEGITKTVDVTITVNKINPAVSVTAPTSVVYGKYEDNFAFNSNVAGEFSINGKNIPVSAGVTEKIFTEIVDGNPAKGSYDLAWTFTPTENDKYNEKTGTVSYNIATRDLSDATVSYSGADNLVYDGTAKTLADVVVTLDGKTLTENTDYTVGYSNNVNAGEATLTINGMGNYTGEIEKKFVIAKAPLSVVSAVAKDREYDGETNVKITDIIFDNLVAGEEEKVIDLNNANAKISSKKVGSYHGITDLTGIQLKTTKEAQNYTLITPSKEKTIPLTSAVKISKKPVTIKDVKIESTKVYDGGTAAIITNKGILSENFDEGKVFISPGLAEYDNKNVGDNKTVTFKGFSIGGEEAENYKLAEQPESQMASITKKTLTVADGTAAVDDKYYDGTTTAKFSDIPALNAYDIVSNDDVSIISTAAPVFNEIGSADEEKTISVTTNLTISGESAVNYDFQIPKVTATIKNYTAGKDDYAVNSNEWLNKDFEITAGAGCQISEGSTLDSTWQEQLTISCNECESEIGTKTFYVKRADGTISRAVNESYKMDKIAPTGTVTFTDAEKPWIKFIENITFGLFYKDAQEVVITSQDQDGLSDVASVEWYESQDKDMTLEEVEAITDWKEYKGNLIVALEDTKKFVYYVKITDNAGNVTYLSTDGAIYDITDPAVTGVINGETYYTSQKVDVADVNLENVTFNGKIVEITDGKIDSITLKGNVDATYTIVATDKAGNKTTVTVTMKPLSDLSENIKDSNVALDDEKELEESEKILEEALKKENLSKLTEEEEKAIREKLSETQELLQEIDEVQEVIKMLEKLPSAYVKGEDGQIVNPKVSDAIDDEEGKLDSAVKAAYKAYSNLSAHQQGLISSNLKHNLSELRKLLTTYSIIDGDGKVWVYNTNGTLTFTGNGPVRKFKNALVDGKEVPADEMKVTKGSTVVELEGGYLYRLGLGNHNFQIVYTDGETDIAEFSIITMDEWNAMMNQQTSANKTGGVATGDSANVLLWGAALAAGTAGIVIAKKKRKDKR